MLGLLGKVTLPTGSYDADRTLNLGANRTQVWLGMPFGWNIGSSYLDPHLTSIEVLPQLVSTTMRVPFVWQRLHAPLVMGAALERTAPAVLEAVTNRPAPKPAGVLCHGGANPHPRV